MVAVKTGRHHVRILKSLDWKTLAIGDARFEDIDALSFSPDSTWFAVAEVKDKRIKIWKTSDWIEVSSFETLLGVTNLDFSPDGTLIAGSSRGVVLVHDSITGQRVNVLYACHCGDRVALSSDGRWIASEDGDGSIPVWESNDCWKSEHIEDPSWELPEAHSKSVDAICFSHDGRSVVTGSKDNTVRVWDVCTQQCRRIIEGRTDVNAVAAGQPIQAFVRYSFNVSILSVAGWVYASGTETIIVSSFDSAELAWLPTAFRSLSSHPSLALWVATHGFGDARSLALYRLEGKSKGAEHG